MLSRLLTFAVAAALLVPTISAQKNLSKAEKAVHEQKLKEYFLNRIVVAKMTMPMTTAGVQTRFDGKKGEWIVSNNEFDLRNWGVGVRAGEKYGITKVFLSAGGIVFWLNDGGQIDGATKFRDGIKTLASAPAQVTTNQEVQQKRSSADGSRVTIITYNLKDQQRDFLEIAKTRSRVFFEIVEDNRPTSARPAPK
jgi:hypothetical protein